MLSWNFKRASLDGARCAPKDLRRTLRKILLEHSMQADEKGAGLFVGLVALGPVVTHGIRENGTVVVKGNCTD